MKDKKEEAVMLFKSGFNCSQAVIGVFAEEFGLDKSTALKIATSFGGGIRKGEVCGAVTGALMALGLKCGHCIEGDLETKNKAYSLTKEFIKKFEDKNETIICKKLLGYDVSKEDELKIVKEKGLLDCICPKLITDGVEILEEMLANK